MSEHYVPSGADPSSLPLFAPPVLPRPGRVRGAFTMTPSTPPPGGAPDVAARVVVLPVSRPYAGELDWGLVAALRGQASDRLSAALTQVAQETMQPSFASVWLRER